MHYLLRIIEQEGFTVTKEHKILDFGCGNGSLVNSFQKDGFNAQGCDLKFKAGPHAERLQEEGLIKTVSLSNYRLPYDDNTFDYIVSETVFEHVQNTDQSIKEIHRILKSGGVALHLFPAKYGIIESHIYVPLASVLNCRAYLLFWALLGIRKSNQKGMIAKDVAMKNKEYLDSSTNYLSTKEINDAFKLHFSEVRFVEKTTIQNSPTRITVTLSKALRFAPFLPYLYRTFKSVAVLTRK